jgi:Rha family phage regulatory protein
MQESNNQVIGWVQIIKNGEGELKDQPITTSYAVSEAFGKRHSDVLRDIRNLHLSEEFRKQHFALCLETKQLEVGSTRTQYYQMTKDGWAFLVLGYTGEKAGKIKEKYVTMFNNMANMLSNEDYIIERSLRILQGRNQLLETQVQDLSLKNELMQATIQAQAPKVKYVEEVLSAKNSWNTTTIAKELGMSAQKLNQILGELKIQFKNEGHYVLYHQYQGQGYTVTRTSSYTDTKGQVCTNISTAWTEKGRHFIHTMVRKHLDKS